jgi:ABC-type nitrate/sulfonate/bicarbonate transport system substrate-binding protein
MRRRYRDGALRSRRFICASLTALAVAILLAGCGGAGSGRPGTRETLLLDFQPNAVHAGIYLAVQRGYDETEGVHLTIRRPGASTDALRALRTGRADAAILDIHDLGIARERGADVVGVMAIVQRPLAALLAQPSVRTPKDLEGRRVGVTGLPSDDAVLRAIVEHAGGNPARVQRTVIGFQAVKALLADRVSAVTAFWNVEGVELKQRRPRVREFRVGDYGAPAYPELVLVVNRTSLEDRRPEVVALIRALQRGYTEAQMDPESAIQAMLTAEPELDRAQLTAQFDAVAPAFTAGVPAFGVLNPARLRAWAAWDQKFGILQQRIDVSRAFDTTLVGRSSRGW